MRSEVADVTGIVKYIGKSVFSAPKRGETLSSQPTHPPPLRRLCQSQKHLWDTFRLQSVPSSLLVSKVADCYHTYKQIAIFGGCCNFLLKVED